MPLTVKGYEALQNIQNLFINNTFTAAQLSQASKKTFVANTLNSLVKEGYLIKISSSPNVYQIVDDFLDKMNSTVNPAEKKSNNDNLHNALKVKNDEFYTFYDDIAAECEHYTTFFQGKIIYLNCDDENSNFWKYFLDNFNAFQLKELWATHLDTNTSYLLKTINGTNIIKQDLIGNGDYNSEECLKLLQQCNIVVTNPPFSKSKEFISLIVNYNKYFLVIGNENAFSSTLLFPLLKDEKIWTGFNKVKKFFTPNNDKKDFGNILWFTNIPNNKTIPLIDCTKLYNEKDYPKYSNFDAINVEKIKDIPKDYMGIMGVPISYVGKHNPKQFEILGLAAGNTKNNDLNFTVPYTPHPLDRGGCGIINNTIRKYTRVFIRRKIND